MIPAKILALPSFVNCVTPVTLPPGRLRLATRPSWIGSAPVCEDNRNSRGRRLCGKRRRSAARGNYGHLTTNQISGHRRQPIDPAFGPAKFDLDAAAMDGEAVSPSPLRKADNGSAYFSGDEALRKPITGIPDCCPRAENGQAVAEPTAIFMKSRRLMSPPTNNMASYREKLLGRKGLPVSAMGQKQTFAAHKPMSAKCRERA